MTVTDRIQRALVFVSIDGWDIWVRTGTAITSEFVDAGSNKSALPK